MNRETTHRKISKFSKGIQLSALGLALITPIIAGPSLVRADDAANAPTTMPGNAANADTTNAAPGGRAGQGNGARGGGQMLTLLVNRVAKAIDSLGLSDDQQKQMDTVIAQAKTDAATDEAQFPTMDPDDRRQAVRDFMQKYRDQVMDILTPDQKAQLREKMGGAGGGAADGAGAAGGGGKLQKLFETIQGLDLTDDQKKQITDLRQDIRDKIRALAQDKADGKDVSQAGQDLRSDIREKLTTILTPDQLQQLRDKMQEEATEPGNAGGGNGANAGGNPGPASNDPAPIGPANNPAPSTQPGN